MKKPPNYIDGWCRLDNGRLRHISGLEVVVVEKNGYTDVVSCKDTLDIFAEYEDAHGTIATQFSNRIHRLCHEAAKWYKHNSPNKKPAE